MAHAYTPGLRVTDCAVLRRERRLPLKLEVPVSVGPPVAPDTIVARTELAGKVQTETVARGKVVVEGSRVWYATLMRAKEIGVAAVVAGGFDDRDLRQLLGRDLGVAITGSEELGFTLVLTEGFGRIPMAARTWRLLEAHRGERASVSGATQIRAGVMRPEIIIPRDGGGAGSETDLSTGLEIGSLLRVIREPHFGR